MRPRAHRPPRGPFVRAQLIKRAGVYYLLYSTGTTHRIVYATATSPLGPFRYRGIVLPPVWGWTTQASAVEWHGEWFLLHHDSECSLGETARRCVKVARMHWDDAPPVPRLLTVVKGRAEPASPPEPPPPPGSPASDGVVNGATRLTADGQPLNAHQGSMVFDPASQRLYLYGNYHRECPATTHCHCVGAEEGWTVTSGIGVYSSPSLAGPWRREAGPILPPFNQPRVIGPVPSRRGLGGDVAMPWRMYVQFPLRLATSASPSGPFELSPLTVSLDHSPQDMNAFLDADGRSYIIYTTPEDYRIRVQRLTADGTAGVPGAISAAFGPPPSEAPVLFQYRPGTYFAVFGHNCWCCAEGAEVFVYRAPAPLGPWTLLGDINVDGAGVRIVPGQTAFVVALPPPLGVACNASFVLALDEWMTGPTRARMHQYWAPLEFQGRLDDRGEQSGGGDFQIHPLASYQSRWSLLWPSPPPPAPPPLPPLPSPPPPLPSPPPPLLPPSSLPVALLPLPMPAPIPSPSMLLLPPSTVDAAVEAAFDGTAPAASPMRPMVERAVRVVAWGGAAVGLCWMLLASLVGVWRRRRHGRELGATAQDFEVDTITNDDDEEEPVEEKEEERAVLGRGRAGTVYRL